MTTRTDEAGPPMRRLVFDEGISRLNLRVAPEMDGLYRARFWGPVPDVKAEGGTVTVRWQRRLRLFDWRKQRAEFVLSAAVPWRIEVRGGASEVIAALEGLDLLGLEIEDGISKLDLDLPGPSCTVPIRITGGASRVTVRRPPGVAARLCLEGGAAGLAFDDQTFGAVCDEARLQSPGYEEALGRYDVEVSGGASKLALTTAPG